MDGWMEREHWEHTCCGDDDDDDDDDTLLPTTYLPPTTDYILPNYCTVNGPRRLALSLSRTQPPSTGTQLDPPDLYLQPNHA
jgi:hypothetical protein